MRVSAPAIGILIALAASCSTTAPSTRARAVYVRPQPERTDGALRLTHELGFDDTRPIEAPLAAQDEQAAPPSGDYPNMYRRMGLSLGAAFYGNFDSSAQIDTSTSAGALLDLEDLLGLD